MWCNNLIPGNGYLCSIVTTHSIFFPTDMPFAIEFTSTYSLSFREIPKYYYRNNSIKGIYRWYCVVVSFICLFFFFFSIYDVTNQTQVFLLCVFYYTFPTFLVIDTELFDHLLIHCHCPTQSLNERHTKSAAFYEWMFKIL